MGNYLIFEAIERNSIEELKKAAVIENVNEQDDQGRTPLHYAIVKKSPIKIFKELIDFGANPSIKDQVYETVLYKAIKFKNKEAVKILMNTGMQLDNPLGIKFTPWFLAKDTPEIADLMLSSTKGAIRLTLTEEERNIIDDMVNSDINYEMENINKLNTSELLHGFVLNFNWNKDIEPMEAVLRNPLCKEITAIEMFERVDGDNWLIHKNINSDYEKKFYNFVNNILERFPTL